jgi:iron(III) transport system permease protein|tara:strand:+ start:7205 stop:8953 length:1749 start_codon:yes stop_codon:yes gene_type:complete
LAAVVAVARKLIPEKIRSLEPQYLILFGGLGLILAFLVIAPLAILLFYSLWSVGPADMEPGSFTLEHYRKAFLDESTYSLLLNTAVFGIGSVIFGLILGVSLAWVVERTNAPMRNFAFVVAIITAGMPPILFAMTWVFLLNPRTGVFNIPFTQWLDWDKGIFTPYSLITLVFVEGLRLTPTIFLMVVGLFRSMDPSLEEAAATSGANTLTTLRRVTLPVMLPGLLGVTIFIGTATIGIFEIPAILGMPGGIHVFATRIYLATSQVPRDYGLATSLGTVAALIGVVGIYYYHRVTRVQQRFATITGKGYRPRRIDLGPWRKWAGTAIIAYFLLMVLLPTVILLYASTQPYFRPPSIAAFEGASLDAYRGLFKQSAFWIGLKNSLLLIAVVPIATVLLSAMVSWVVVRSSVRGRGILDALAFVPFTAPSIVFGLAFLLMALWIDWIPLYGTIWLIMLVHVSRFLAYGTRTTNGAMFQLHKELEEAGAVSGVGWFTVFRQITLRLLVPSLVAGWLWVAIHSGRELSMALLISTRDSQILSVISWAAWENGRSDEAAALGIILMMIMSTIVVTARLLTLRLTKEQG